MKKNYTRRDFISTMTSLGVLGVAAGTTSVLSGCSIPLNYEQLMWETAQRDVSHTGGKLRFALRRPAAIDPFYVQESSGIQVVSMLFDPLVRYDYQQKKLVPAAATAWKASEDGKTFTFRLAKDMLFHNGEAVGAKDFKYSWERLIKSQITDKASTNASYLSSIYGAKSVLAGEADEVLGIRILSTHVLEVTLEEPFYDFLLYLTYPAMSPVPASAVEAHETDFFKRPIGNGPFMLEEAWDANSDSLSFVRFDHYYKDPALLKYVDLVFYPDAKDKNASSSKSASSPDKKELGAANSYDDFKRKLIDVTSIPIAQVGEAKDNYGEALDGYTGMPRQQVIGGQQICTNYLRLNLKAEPLLDLRVRKALNLAIDRMAVCAALPSSNCAAAGDIVPPGIKGVTSNVWSSATGDLEAAKQLLDEYAHDRDFSARKITLVLSGSDFQEKIFAVIEENLKAAGFYVHKRTVSTAEEYEIIKDRATIELVGWVADCACMENFLVPIFSKNGNANSTGYENSEFEERIKEARAIKDDAARELAYQRVNEIVAKDLPVIPLIYPALDMVCSEHVNDIYIAPDKIADLANTWVSV